MPRADESDVRAVIDTEADTDVISGYIDDAALEVNERVQAANVGYSNDRMAKLEKYLAAHLVRFLWDRQETSIGVSNVQTDYSGAFGEGLTATSAGQVFLDTDTADVFPSSVTTDDEPEDAGMFVTRDRFVSTATPGDSGRVEGTEQPRE